MTRGRSFLLKSNENDTFFRILFGHIKTFYYLCTNFENRRYGRGLGAYMAKAARRSGQNMIEQHKQI